MVEFNLWGGEEKEEGDSYLSQRVIVWTERNNATGVRARLLRCRNPAR